MFDLYELRIVLEAEAARWAAERRTRLDLVRLRQANDEMKTTGGASEESMRETNFVSTKHFGTLATTSHSSIRWRVFSAR